MRILILGGKAEADFVIRSFNTKKNVLTVVNKDKRTAQYLSESNGVEVLVSSPTKLYTYELIKVKGYDLVISLLDSDADNFVACKIAKDLYGIKKAICTVTNPDNVKIFGDLGIDSVISGTFLLTERITEESDVESLTKTMSLENEKVSIVEFKVKKDFACAGKSIQALQLPSTGNICCVYRNPEVIIPRGNTVLKVGDRLILACAPKDEEQLISFLKTPKEVKND